MSRLSAFILFIFVTCSVYATHTSGLTVSYRHLSGDSVLVSCEVAWQCAGTFINNGACVWGGPNPTSAYYSIFCSESGILMSDTALLDSLAQMPQVCDSAGYNSCDYGPCALAGMQYAYYEAIVDLSEIDTAECGELMFVWSMGSRSLGTNYTGQPGIVAWGTVNFQDFPENNSVQFKTQTPAPFYCEGKEVTYSWGAIDPDGDSLHWELDTAMDVFINGNFAALSYASGYSPTQPMPGVVTIDSETGQLSFTTSKPLGYDFANYAVAVTVSEYDGASGLFKGRTHRDVQFYIVDSCDNEAPIQQGPINSTATLIDSVTVQTCFGQGVQFDIVYADFDSNGVLTNDSLEIYCDVADYIDGASYNHTGGNPDTLSILVPEVNWSNFTKDFTVHVSDDYCPFVGFNTYSYGLASSERTYLDDDTLICSEDTIQLNAHGGDTFLWHVLSGEPIVVGTNFGCTGCQKPWVNISQNTIYLVTSNLSAACGNSDTIYIDVFDEYEVNMEAINGGSITPLVYCASDEIDSFLVSPLGGTYSGLGIIDSVAGYFDPGSVNATPGNVVIANLTYGISGSCANSDVRQVRVNGLPNTIITSPDTFVDTVSSVQLQSPFNAGTWSDAANSGNPTASGLFQPSLIPSPDSVWVFHEGDEDGCINKDSLLIHIVPLDSTIGVGELQSKSIALFPNPVSDLLHVKATAVIQYVRIRDARGLMVGRSHPKAAMFDISFVDFKPGTYLLDFYTSDGNEIIRKIIVQ